MVEVALVLGEEEGHALQYLPGESDNTVWPGNYKLNKKKEILFLL